MKNIGFTLGDIEEALKEKDNSVFAPWDDKKLKGRKPFASITDIVKTPPCLNCIFWNPVTEGDEIPDYRGVVLCHSKNMYNDFSCFKTKED